MDLCDHTITKLSKLLKKREISSNEIVESVFRRIESRENTLNAYITLRKEEALKQADEADAKLRSGSNITPLTGIPIAIKDNICTKGIRTTCGSQVLNNYIPPFDATVIQRLNNENAIFPGKTNLDEFGMGSSNENSAFGPTRNPANEEYVTGGSSGGSAAAVSSGETIAALGTDTGGSIRMPAAFCGVVGIKPTYGRVSRYGLISYASSLDQIGVLSRTVQDSAFVLNAICGHDSSDSTSANVNVPDFTSSIKKGVKGLRIGLPEEYFIEGLDMDIHSEIRDVVKLYEQAGAEIIDISLPHTKFAVSAYYLLATAEASSNLARYDGVKYGLRSEQSGAESTGMTEETRHQGFGDEVKRRIMLGTYVLSAGYYDAYYLKAQKVRTLIKNDFNTAFKKVDVILSPVTPTPPFRLGEKIDDPLTMYLMDVYTVSLNMAGLPGMSIPCGKINGLPIGFQLTGKPFDEETLIRAGYEYELTSGRVD
jgi:aspartyl-tRNA(Asn)/glutamyl-tRNA(Gln) amidotransferase subunit A